MEGYIFTFVIDQARTSKGSSIGGGWVDQFYPCMQTDSREPKNSFKEGFGMAGCGFKREFNEIQNVLVWVGFYGVIMCY